MDIAGIAQLVERNLAKVEVASSSLVSRSKLFKREADPASLFSFPAAPIMSGHLDLELLGAVAAWMVKSVDTADLKSLRTVG